MTSSVLIFAHEMNGIKGDGKGPSSARLSPTPTNFKESHGEKMADRGHFWKITSGRGAMPRVRRINSGRKMGCDKLYQYVHETEINRGDLISNGTPTYTLPRK